MSNSGNRLGFVFYKDGESFMSKIELKNVSFGYDKQATLLFDNVNMIMDTTWKLGLIGRNGRGKTTLLKMLLEKVPYAGKIQHQLTFVYFPQTIQDKSQLTYYVLSQLADFEQWELERELNLLDANPDILWREFQTLSGGEQTKVLLALLFLDQGNFPLIDEPTNHLDKKTRQQVANYLKKKKQGFIVVSHDRQFIDDVVDHILSIEKSQLVLYQGNFSVYEEQKALRDAYEEAQNLKLKKEIGRLKQTAAEKAEWSRSRESDKHKSQTGFIDTELRRVPKGAIGSDAARTMKRSKAIIGRMENQIIEKEGLLQDIEYIDPLKMNSQKSHHQRFLQVEKLQLGFNGSALFEPISFEILTGECLALTGENGVGKSSVIQALLGSFTGDISGMVQLPQNLKISYVRQNYEDNQGTLSEFAEANGLVYQDFLNNLKKLGMERDVFHNEIQEMSMGQRKKVELAKSLAQPANFFIWDEPLNYLDVFNHQQLEVLIQSVRPTMILVEHDQVFIKKVATKEIPLIVSTNK